jgi:rhamnopyranosyl-N-acetylglucosaminyl-diphospho-decaprenol beta-1,3/1,4-galactofuranosyltransferase
MTAPTVPIAQAPAPKLAVIIVTHNRLALLQECVAAVLAQTRPLDEVIVIDNASTDGTGAWLDEQVGEHPTLTVIHQGNLGGAGGFHRGIKEGYSRGHDWFWCMDDDTIPHPDALERLCAAPPFTQASTGFLGSLVQWTDGTPHKMNMWFDAPDGAQSVGWYSTVARDKCVPCATASFVSILISRRAVEKVGLPIKEFFIWCDDSEFTYRISQHFSCFWVLDSVALHKTPVNARGTLSSVTPREYFKLKYGLRNEVFFRRSQKKPPVIKAIQVGLLLARHSFQLLKHRAPLFLMRSLWSGLLFSPQIERVAPHDDASR